MLAQRLRAAEVSRGVASRSKVSPPGLGHEGRMTARLSGVSPGTSGFLSGPEKQVDSQPSTPARVVKYERRDACLALYGGVRTGMRRRRVAVWGRAAPRERTAGRDAGTGARGYTGYKVRVLKPKSRAVRLFVYNQKLCKHFPVTLSALSGAAVGPGRLTCWAACWGCGLPRATDARPRALCPRLSFLFVLRWRRSTALPRGAPDAVTDESVVFSRWVVLRTVQTPIYVFSTTAVRCRAVPRRAERVPCRRAPRPRARRASARRPPGVMRLARRARGGARVRSPACPVPRPVAAPSSRAMLRALRAARVSQANGERKAW